MTATEQRILNEMAQIRQLLERLVAPVAAEEARQLATASRAQLKEHNDGIRERARAKRKQGRAA